jgi:hypothetical protein
MTPAILMLAAAAMVMPASAGVDVRLVAGLAVNLDFVPEPMTVDGVSMIVQRATGPGVPELARRIEATWRNHGSEVQAHLQGSWMVRSRLQGQQSEVLQWRADTEIPELLLSEVDLRAPVGRVPEPDVILPAGCVWGRSVFGQGGSKSYLQRSARCPNSAHALSMRLKQSLPTQGWKVLVVTGSGVQVERAGVEGFIGLSSQQGNQATWLTWLRVENTK